MPPSSANISAFQTLHEYSQISFCPSGAKEKTHKIHLHETTLLIAQKRCTPHMENKVTVRDINPTWQEEAVPGYNPLKADVGTPHIPIKVAYFLCQAGVWVFVAG